MNGSEWPYMCWSAVKNYSYSLRGIYRVRCGSGSCTFLTFGFGFGSVFGKTLILILFVFAGFGFFHISLYSLVYSESWSLKDGHRHIKMPKNILNLTPKPITHAPPHRFNLSTAGIVPKLFHPLVGGSPEFFWLSELLRNSNGNSLSGDVNTLGEILRFSTEIAVYLGNVQNRPTVTMDH